MKANQPASNPADDDALDTAVERLGAHQIPVQPALVVELAVELRAAPLYRRLADFQDRFPNKHNVRQRPPGRAIARLAAWLFGLYLLSYAVFRFVPSDTQFHIYDFLSRYPAILLALVIPPLLWAGWLALDAGLSIYRQRLRQRIQTVFDARQPDHPSAAAGDEPASPALPELPSAQPDRMIQSALRHAAAPRRPLASLLSSVGILFLVMACLVVLALTSYEIWPESSLAQGLHTNLPRLYPGAPALLVSRCVYLFDPGKYRQAVPDCQAAARIDPGFANAHYTLGWASFYAGDDAQALEAFNRVLALDQQNLQAYAGRGSVYLDQGQLEQAIADFDRALTGPGNGCGGCWPDYGLVVAYAGRGRAHARLGNVAQAAADLDEAVRLDPTYRYYYQDRADLYQPLHAREKLLANWNEAIANNPDADWPYMGRAGAYKALGEFSAAVDEYTRYIAIHPDADWAYFGRADAYRGLSDLPAALDDYTRLIALKPDQAWVYAFRGDVYLLLDQVSQASADLTRAIQLQPDYTYSYYRRATALIRQGQQTQALADLDTALRLDPANKDAATERANLLRQAGDLPGVIASWSAVIHAAPQAAWAYRGRCDAYFDQQQYTDAAADCATAIQLDPQDESAYRRAGEAYRRAQPPGYQQTVLALWANAVLFNPEAAWAYAGRGELHQELEQFDLALADYSRAIDLAPENGAYYRQRGDVYQKLDQKDQAVADYRQALELDPCDLCTYRALAGANAGDTQARIAVWNEAIRRNPQAAWPFLERGIVWMDLGAYRQAVADFTQAIRLDPQNRDAYQRRATAYEYSAWVRRQMEERDDALQKSRPTPSASHQPDIEVELYHQLRANWLEAVKNNPVTAWPYGELCRFSTGKSQTDLLAILDCYQHAIRIDPREKELYINVDYIYAQLGYNQPEQDWSELRLANWELAVQNNPERAWAYNKRADYYRGLRENEKALADFTAAISLDPGDGINYEKRGLIFLEMHRYSQAIADFNQVISIKPESIGIYIQRARAYFRSGDRLAIINNWDQAIHNNPGKAWPYVHRGDAHLLLGQLPAAIADYQAAIRLSPTGGEKYEMLDQLYAAARDPGGRIAVWDKAVQNNPQAEWSYSGRARVYAEIGQPGLALADYTTALQIHPGFEWFYTARANIYQQTGDWQSLLANWNEAVQRNPQAVWPLVARARAYLEMGACSPAIQDYTRLIDQLLSPEQARQEGNFQQLLFEVHAGRAQVYIRCDDRQGLAHNWDAVSQAFPALDWPFVQRGQAWLDIGENELAASEFSALIEHRPPSSSSSSFYDLRASAYRKMGDVRRLLDNWEQAVQSFPNASWAYQGRGLARLENGQVQPALDDLARAQAYRQLADAYHSLGQPQGVIAAWSLAIQDTPKNDFAWKMRGDAYFETGQYALSIADYTTALRLSPNAVGLYSARGRAYLAAGYRSAAIQDWQYALLLYEEIGDSQMSAQLRQWLSLARSGAAIPPGQLTLPK